MTYLEIDQKRIEFHDVTVLSSTTVLRWFKILLDAKHMVKDLKAAWQIPHTTQDLLDMAFGFGVWETPISLSYNGKRVNLKGLMRRGSKSERALYVPAGRALLLCDGWAYPFQKLPSDIPYFIRSYSQYLFQNFVGWSNVAEIPFSQVPHWKEIQAFVYQGRRVLFEEDVFHKRRLRLQQGQGTLPFMAWPTEQREFTALLLGLLPLFLIPKQEGLDWLLIEEPEFGLSDQTLDAMLSLLAALVRKGYRIVLASQHTGLEKTLDKTTP